MPTTRYVNSRGETVPGVTTVIGKNLGWNKGALLYWANQEGLAGRSHRDTAQRAADAGTVGHYLIECDIMGVEPDCSGFDPSILSSGETAYLNFLEWKETFRFRPIASEVHLVSEKHQFGATPDLIAEVNGKVCLVDWKTGNGVYPDHKIQLAAYRVAWEENNPDMPITGFHLLRIAKNDASFAHYYWHSLPEAWEVFKHLLAIHDLYKALK
jgi:hypothetical protein